MINPPFVRTTKIRCSRRSCRLRSNMIEQPSGNAGFIDSPRPRMIAHLVASRPSRSSHERENHARPRTCPRSISTPPPAAASNSPTSTGRVPGGASCVATNAASAGPAGPAERGCRRRPPPRLLCRARSSRHRWTRAGFRASPTRSPPPRLVAPARARARRRTPSRRVANLGRPPDRRALIRLTTQFPYRTYFDGSSSFVGIPVDDARASDRKLCPSRVSSRIRGVPLPPGSPRTK